jgi:hypothetical protein
MLEDKSERLKEDKSERLKISWCLAIPNDTFMEMG